MLPVMNVIRTFPLVAVSGIVALFGLLARCFAMRDRTACESQVCANDYDGLTVVLRLLLVDEIKATGLELAVNEGTSETGTGGHRGQFRLVCWKSVAR